MTINLPEEVVQITAALETAGYEAYCVGGAVRDTLMGITPGDWDIATSAKPDETKKLFCDFKTIDTGLKHGTVTVIINQKPFEITTYRIDGTYADNRHPQNVQFTNLLQQDLARRDFTVNAIAYNHRTGLVDLFGGENDIYNCIIRTVGDPDERFAEDGLRIMRALRFCAVTGFKADALTSDAIHRNKDLLKNISSERLAAELTKLVCGKNAFEVLMRYHDVLSVFIPEIAPAVGFEQHGEKHAYDVWEHICRTVDTIPPDKVLRLTMLLHDLGKVPTHKLDENANSTFKNHAAVGGEIARDILTRLRYDKNTINGVSFLVANHDFEPPKTKIELKHRLKTLTPEDIKTLLIIKKSDRGALSEKYRDISESTAQTLVWLKEIEQNGECCSLKDLAVNGNDLIHCGITGKDVGKTLDILLDGVIDGKIENNKHDLLTYIL